MTVSNETLKALIAARNNLWETGRGQESFIVAAEMITQLVVDLGGLAEEWADTDRCPDCGSHDGLWVSHWIHADREPYTDDDVDCGECDWAGSRWQVEVAA